MHYTHILRCKNKYIENPLYLPFNASRIPFINLSLLMAGFKFPDISVSVRIDLYNVFSFQLIYPNRCEQRIKKHPKRSKTNECKRKPIRRVRKKSNRRWLDAIEWHAIKEKCSSIFSASDALPKIPHIYQIAKREKTGEKQKKNRRKFFLFFFFPHFFKVFFVEMSIAPVCATLHTRYTAHKWHEHRGKCWDPCACNIMRWKEKFVSAILTIFSIQFGNT